MQVVSMPPCDMLRLMQERRFYSVDEMAGMTPDQRAEVIEAATCHSWDEVPVRGTRLVVQSLCGLGLVGVVPV
jgi:hypothetical protein